MIAQSAAVGADQKAGDELDRLLRRRQADPQQLGRRTSAASRSSDTREMAPRLLRRHGMDFVDDDRPGRRQHRPAGIRAEQDVERFRRGHDDMRRPAAHLLALAGGVSPVRTQVRISTSGRPCSRKASRIPASGASRFLWISFDNAFNGET